MGTDSADYDKDGYPDLVVDNLANQKYALYKNNKDGSFTYVTQTQGVGRASMLHSGWGIKFFDYDNDGWQDLLIAQGHDLDTIQRSFPQLRYREPMLLLRNTGKAFEDVSARSGAVFQQAWVGRGLAIGDLDNDGRVDAVVTTNGGPAYVLHNNSTNGNHWLTLTLIGHKSNRDAIGAVVKIITQSGAQYATVSTSGSYLSSSDKRLHFGLGSADSIKELDVQWPSGKTQTLKDVKPDHMLTVDEPQ
jgi:hypothetical protein